MSYKDVVALVNGQEIKKRDLEGRKIYMTLQKGRDISDQEALNELIKENVALQEAQNEVCTLPGKRT